jgi:hypothetical protein
MKPFPVIIFILFVLHLSPACSTSEGYKKDESKEYVTIKHNFPDHLTPELIEIELDLDKIVKVKTKFSSTPIKVISVENSDLLGATSNGQEVKFNIADITEAWSLKTIEKSQQIRGPTSEIYRTPRSDSHIDGKAIIGYPLMVILLGLLAAAILL